MSVLALPFNIVLGQLFIAIGRKKKKGTKFWWKEINLSLLTNNMIFYTENIKESAKFNSIRTSKWNKLISKVQK